MSGRLMTMLTVGVCLAAIACSDQRQPLPAAPSYHTITSTSSGCDFVHVHDLVEAYFGEESVVDDLVTAMEDSVPFSPGARNQAFNIMSHIDAAVTASTEADPADGSDLVNHLILCMFNPSVPADLASFPATFPEDFTDELTPSEHGAFSVRGGTPDPLTAAVLSRPVADAFSGVGPGGTSNWQTTVIGSASPERVLIYGQPGTTSPQHYEWKVVPRSATFAPGVVVGLCLEESDFPTSMVEEENVGALAFKTETFLPAGCSDMALLESGLGFTLASRLARFGAEVFGPRALWATTTVSPGGLGGSTGGIRSEFGPLDLSETGGVTLTVIQQPPATVKVGQTFIVKVKATSGGTAVGGVSVKLESFNNNGAKVVLSGTNPVVTGEDGVAMFTLTLNKPGAYRLRTTSLTTVLGRPAITVSQVTSVKFNVKPK